MFSIRTALIRNSIGNNLNQRNSLKEKIEKYKLFETANKLNEIISSEINKNVFKKKHNLSGEILHNGGIEIYNSVSLVMFEPNLGPLVKLNIDCSNSNQNGTESNLKLERVNGITFYIQYWFSLIFTLITFGIGIYQMFSIGFEKTEFLFLPLFGIGYHFLIRIIANGTTDSLISKVEKILRKEKIKYKKL